MEKRERERTLKPQARKSWRNRSFLSAGCFLGGKRKKKDDYETYTRERRQISLALEKEHYYRYINHAPSHAPYISYHSEIHKFQDFLLISAQHISLNNIALSNATTFIFCYRQGAQRLTDCTTIA
ncbi:uncharacterized protein H6S33_005988 [Morchella sextelata]|uniref:uncharacterized protein n=1 Tax=Morchella sextelata TaxID=1174677 RepID=UPI001D04C2BE|nr:uncharacterized protein H6S33_005988 [Morchella sextelata]KAH0614102.1 hypothetical protein H6S33_005988 [Morchella sextelata]